MAITLQNAPVTASKTAIATTLTFSVTVNSGSNQILVVCVSGEINTHTVTGITFGGVALTQLGRQANASFGYAEIWYLKNPSPSTANVVVTDSSAGVMAAGAYVLSGVDQTTTWRTTVKATGSAASASVTVASVASGDFLIDSLDIDGTGHSSVAGADQTKRWGIEPSAGTTTGNSSTQPGANGGAMSWTWTTSAPYSLLANALIPASGSPTAYSLDCQPGSYTVTGTAASPVAARALSASPGSYAVTGSSARPVAARLINASPGTYAITGTAALPVADRLLSASPGSYTLTGVAVGFTAATAGSFVLAAEPGSYAVTGVAASPVATRVFNASPGAYSITGSATGVVAGRAINASPGSYVLTGSAALPVASRLLSATPGSYTLSGAAVTFTLTSLSDATIAVTVKTGVSTGTGRTLTAAASGRTASSVASDVTHSTLGDS